MKRRPELLSPAGDFERFEAALRFGADAVYLAGSSFGMRAGPQNFPEDDLIKAVKEAHEKGVKVYLTLNTLPRNSEIPLLPDFIEMTAGAGVDAYIAADIGTMAYCKVCAVGAAARFHTGGHRKLSHGKRVLQYGCRANSYGS